MTTATNNVVDAPKIYVVHPLDDAPEQKFDGEGLGHIEMSRAVRYSLMTLRGYLLLVIGLAGWRLVELGASAAHLVH